MGDGHTDSCMHVSSKVFDVVSTSLLAFAAVIEAKSFLKIRDFSCPPNISKPNPLKTLHLTRTLKLLTPKP